MKIRRFRLVAAVVVFLAASWLTGQTLTGPGSLQGVAGAFPKGVQGFLVVDGLETFLGNLSAVIGELPVPDVSKTMKQASEESIRTLGFDVTSPDAWRQAGFDLDQPVGFAMMASPGANLMMLVAGVRNEQQFVETLGGWFERADCKLVKNDGPGQPVYHVVEKGEQTSFALIFKGNRAFALASPDKVGDMYQRLQAILDQPVTESLASDPDFQAATGQLPARGYISVFLRDPEKILPNRGGDVSDGTQVFLKVVKAAGLVLGENASGIRLVTRFPIPIVSSLKPGLDCASLLSRMEKPSFSISASVDWTEELATFCRVMRENESKRAKPPADASEAAQAEWVDFLCAVKGKVALGGALYPRPEDFAERKSGFTLLNFILSGRFEDTSAADALFARVKATTLSDPVKCGNGELCTLGGDVSFLSLGRAGDAYFFGFTDRVKQALGATEALWTPRCGGTDILACEFFPGDFFQSARINLGPDEAEAILRTLLKPGSSMFTTFNAQPDGLLVRMETKGARLLMPMLVAIITVPSLMEAKQSAQRNVAVATLHAIARAEEAYTTQGGVPARRGTFADLVEKGLLDERFTVAEPVLDGYRYTLQVTEKGFRCEARGVGPNKGTVLFIDERGEIRTGAEGSEVQLEKLPGPSNRPDADYQDLGNRIMAAYNARSAEKAMEIYDMDAVFRSVESIMEPGEKTRTGCHDEVSRWFHDVLSEEMVTMELTRSRLRMLRVLDVDGEKRIRFRSIGNGIDYLDVSVRETPSGQLKATNSHTFSTGQILVDAFRQSLKSSRDAQSESGDLKSARDFYTDREIYSLIRGKVLYSDLDTALKLWDKLSPASRSSRRGQSVRMELADLQGETELLAALRKFSEAYPDDPMIHVWEYEYALTSKDTNGALKALDELDRMVKGDPYLDADRAMAELGRRGFDEARRLAKKVLDLDPEFMDPCVVLLFCDILEARHAEAAKWCETLRRRHGIDMSETLKGPDYEAFTASAEYRAWRESVEKAGRE